MNSLKINFISFILFLSVLRPTDCVEFSSVLTWSSVYCNPKSLSILPVQLYFLEYFKAEIHSLCGESEREFFCGDDDWDERDEMRRNGFFASFNAFEVKRY